MSFGERLVLFDMDGTLIDSSYRVTDDGIYAAIEQAQAAGWTVGLNSDSPYEYLRLWRDRLGMNGPIVAEKGAVVEIDGEPVFATADAAAVSAAKERILGYVAEQNIALWRGNPTEALRNGLRFGKPGEPVLLLNDVSLCSLRFFVRRVGPDGELRIDNPLAEAVVADCRPLLPEFDAVDEDYNPSFGLLIASRRGVTKRAGVQRLLQAAGLARCVMVGNSMSDYVGDDVADQFAVSNASPAYQAVASTVAQPLTNGCVTILKQLVRYPISNDQTEELIR